MSTHAPRPCPHDLRPGTTVCLHCRHAEHVAAAARRRRLALRAGAPALAVALLAGGAAAAVRDGGGPPAAATSAAGGAAEPGESGDRAGRRAASGAAPAGSAVRATPTSAPPPPAPPSPLVAEGRTALADGVVAERRGDTVAVHFDLPLTRTRRAEKFERIVRATLPRIYGPAADSALAAVPAGTLAGGADLLTELPARGVRLRTPDGAALALWPETRPGRDGPLVVTYRTTSGR